MKIITAARHHHWTLGHRLASHESCSLPEGLAAFLFLPVGKKRKKEIIRLCALSASSEAGGEIHDPISNG